MKKPAAVMAGSISEFRFWQKENPEIEAVYASHPKSRNRKSGLLPITDIVWVATNIRIINGAIAEMKQMYS